jgi:thioredoxin reductase (NADPH)
VSRQAHDIVIVGGGPAGLAAGLYAARARRKTVLLEKRVIGGQIALTELAENYPGVPSVNGFDLAQTMLRQAESYDYAAGDARRNATRQVVSSAGDGATAAIAAEE